MGRNGSAKSTGCGKLDLKTINRFLKRMLGVAETLWVNLLSIAASESTVEMPAIYRDPCRVDLSRGDAPEGADLPGIGNILLRSDALPSVSNLVLQDAVALADLSPVRHLRADVWNFAHPSFYL